MEEDEKEGLKVTDRRIFPKGVDGLDAREDEKKAEEDVRPDAAAAPDPAPDEQPAQAPPAEGGDAPSRPAAQQPRHSQAAGPGPADDARDQGARSAGEQAPPREITFADFVVSLSTSALLALGVLKLPEQEEPQVNLLQAKQTIDLLGILAQKTSGNLDEQEQRLLQEVLTDLRMRYVEASR